MNVRPFFVTAFVSLFFVQNIWAGNTDHAVLDTVRFDGPVKVVILQRDGKLIVGGNFSWPRSKRAPVPRHRLDLREDT